ncbi:uncharacterized protein LOC143895548 [Temnothorax americanus]|uniref:uncharacterized protein LOC143895548 n=1 Tax=Temnothorax americanus TaxID=1964332 RepID=UPI004069075F
MQRKRGFSLSRDFPFAQYRESGLVHDKSSDNACFPETSSISTSSVFFSAAYPATLFKLVCKVGPEPIMTKVRQKGITQGSGTDKMKRKMIKRISEYARPKIWCPQEDYNLPGDGISMSITSAFPSSTNEKSEIYYNTGIKRKDGGIFVLHPSMAITTDATCHRYIN